MPSCAENERIKRQYFTYLREAKHLAERTLDGVVRGVALFETFTKGQDFRKFHIQQAIDFKASLTTQINRQGKAGLATTHHRSGKSCLTRSRPSRLPERGEPRSPSLPFAR
jgi:hypothetical protein